MGANTSITDKRIILKNKGIRNLEADIKRYDLIRSLKSPRSIILSKNKIVVISPLICEELTKLKNVHDYLREINLSHNKIMVIPGALLQLVNIEILRLDHNEIEIIPPKLADCLYNLQHLRLNHNKIKIVPWNFNKLYQLKVITLNNNEISYIPNTFGELNPENLQFSLHPNPLDSSIFDSNTPEGTMAAILNQKIPREYRDQVHTYIEEWDTDGKGKTELERKFLYFLQQEHFRKDFGSFMEKEFSHENLDLWQHLDRFKWRYCSIYEIRSPAMIEDALFIFNKYIVENAPHWVNVPGQEGHHIKALFLDEENLPTKINQWVFDGVYESTLKLMYDDTFSRYRLTEQGTKNFEDAVKLWDRLPMNRIRKMK